jgi:DNA-binding IclR family transcriptional regulator
MPDEHRARAGVKSDETLLAIIDYMRDSDRAGVTEIAAHLDLAKSTVHNHLASMADHGFVVKQEQNYRLGLEFFNVGQSVRNRFDVYRAAEPVIKALREDTEEMVWLFAHERGRVMCIDGYAGDTDIDVNSLIGSWAYMHCNSAGKSILSRLPKSDVAAIIDRYGLPMQTSNTITDPAELHEELKHIREQDYALNIGEDLEGIHAVSVPLVFEEKVMGALSIAGPAYRVTRDRCENEFAETLFAARNDIEINLAYT